MNIFQADYTERLRSWNRLKKDCKNLSVLDSSQTVDNWWQAAPLINYHLHWNDSESWPSPWELLSENNYSTLTRAIGMCYTLLMIDINNIQLVQATDCQAEQHELVIVDNRYVLNFWPNTVMTNKISDFAIKQSLNISLLKKKILGE